MSGDDLAILGEAALILARIQTDPESDARAGEIAGLGRATIQIVLTDAIARIGHCRWPS